MPEDGPVGLHGALTALDEALRVQFHQLRHDVNLLRGQVKRLESALARPVRYTLYITDDQGAMLTPPAGPVQILDNDTTKHVVLVFTDALNLPTTDPTATVVFNSSAPAIATVGPATAGTWTDPTTNAALPAMLGAITPVGLGSVSFSATVTNADGTVVNGQPVTVTIEQSPATGFLLTVG